MSIPYLINQLLFAFHRKIPLIDKLITLEQIHSIFKVIIGKFGTLGEIGISISANLIKDEILYNFTNNGNSRNGDQIANKSLFTIHFNKLMDKIYLPGDISISQSLMSFVSIFRNTNQNYFINLILKEIEKSNSVKSAEIGGILLSAIGGKGAIQYFLNEYIPINMSRISKFRDCQLYSIFTISASAHSLIYKNEEFKNFFKFILELLNFYENVNPKSSLFFAELFIEIGSRIPNLVKQEEFSLKLANLLKNVFNKKILISLFNLESEKGKDDWVNFEREF